MQRTQWMYDVDVSRLFVVDDQRENRWVRRKVDEVDKHERYRCAHCQGEVRLYQGKTVEWHARHIHMADAVKCPGSPEGKSGNLLPPPPK